MGERHSAAHLASLGGCPVPLGGHVALDPGADRVLGVLGGAGAGGDGGGEPPRYASALDVRRCAAGRGRGETVSARPVEDRRHRANRVVSRRGHTASGSWISRACATASGEGGGRE